MYQILGRDGWPLYNPIFAPAQRSKSDDELDGARDGRSDGQLTRVPEDDAKTG